MYKPVSNMLRRYGVVAIAVLFMTVPAYLLAKTEEEVDYIALAERL